jgi:hypothetical protein
VSGKCSKYALFQNIDRPRYFKYLVHTVWESYWLLKYERLEENLAPQYDGLGEFLWYTNTAPHKHKKMTMRRDKTAKSYPNTPDKQ